MCSNEHVRAVYLRDIVAYQQRHLLPPEVAVLRRFKGRWPTMSMLDVGVGAGRTSYIFAAVARHYLGIDYLPEMISKARQLVAEDQTVRFAIADVRDLSNLSEKFDFVLVSCNALDTMEWPDRTAALRQLRCVTRQGGYLLLSGHSLHALRTHLPVHNTPFGWSAKELYQWTGGVRATIRYLRERRKLNLDQVEASGRARFPDGAHNFALDISYVSVAEQRRELGDAAYELEEVFDLTGTAVDENAPPADLSLHYLARARQGTLLGWELAR
jgi:SAM-dependent methyltransferase